MERVCEVRPDWMRADRVGIGHIGSMHGGFCLWLELALVIKRRTATYGELIWGNIGGPGIDERCAEEQRSRDWICEDQLARGRAGATSAERCVAHGGHVLRD
jgi:hypothetical protein